MQNIGFGDHRASGATPTPLIAGDHVIVQFNGIVAVLDLRGRLIWKDERSIPKENIVFGVGSSPVAWSNRIFSVQERDGPFTTTSVPTYVEAYGQTWRSV